MGDPVEALQGIDLAALSALASGLGVESYVFNRLGPGQSRLGSAQADWFAELRQRVAGSAVSNLLRDALLSEALDRLKAEGIEFILLKGAALRLLRPELAGRFQTDVDLLLRRPDLEKAEEILIGRGFRLDESSRSRQAALETHFHLGYERDGAAVELHWSIDRSTPAGCLETFWDRSETIERDGRSWRILAPEHRLLFGCLHLSRHAFYYGLRWLADLALELPETPEALERFVADARDWPQRAVRVPLWTLRTFGAPGIEVFSDDLAEAGAVERSLLPDLLFHLLMGEGWHGLPGWRAEKALRTWLFSSRPLVPLLAETSGSGLSQRFQAWRGRRVVEETT